MVASRPLYEKREKLVAKIPNFWPLVLEQAPPEIDEYIQPSDSALLLSSLTSLTVTHFEIEGDAAGDPRSVSIKWEFSENDYFEDRVLEKKFWNRHAEDGWSGLVSEPVEIRWKKDKDLTGGLLALVKRVWDEEQQQTPKAGESDGKKKTKGASELTPNQKALKAKMEESGLGGLSFFAWFGFRGRRISAEEDRRAREKQKERRKLRQEGKPVEPEAEEEEDDDDDDLEALEIFPDGESLAVAIVEDVWPGAIRYFSELNAAPNLSKLAWLTGGSSASTRT